MPVKLTLPADLTARLSNLGDALAAASDDIVFAYLFGSASTGRMTGRSDVDIAIYCVPGSDVHAVRLAAARAASKHLCTDAVDLVVLNTAPISLVGRVLTSRIVLLDRDPPVRHQFESVRARMFQDFRIREHRILAGRSRG